MFSSKRASPQPKRSRTGSHSTTLTTATAPPPRDSTPLVSPLQMTFDFELESPGATSPPLNLPFSPIDEPRSASPARPTTSHGLPSASQKNDWSSASGRLQAPTFPPIPRVSSNHSSAQSANSEEPRKQESRARDESDNISTRSRKSVLNVRLSFEHPIDMLPSLSRPGTPLSAGVSSRRQTLGAQSVYSNDPRMESCLFPSKNDVPPSPSVSQVPAMSRSFIDSRDKPYSPQPPKPFTLQTNHSSPDLIRTQTQSPLPSPKPPLSAVSSRKTWISPKPSLQNLSQGTTNSGTTARPSTQASASSSPSTTIGTPYQATAESFPPPQLVATRPKTSGPSSTLGGVAVLTHHTSTPKPVSKPSEKRKTRLLNPLALLQRRRSNQDPENAAEERSQRQAQAQALARQRDVVASGVNKPPEDFDPRIKGKVVHDFSAPRRQRNTFDEIELQHVMENAANTTMFPPRNSSLISREASTDGGQRRSTHTPVFMEHLSENPEAARRMSSIQAENLENKDFLHRASKQTTYSQESGVLPPFARRSQQLDPLQASFYQDDDSKRSSDPSSGRERDSTLSSVSEVSPITAHSNNPIIDVRGSMSPISPGSPSKSFGQLADSKLLTQQGRSVSEGSKATSSGSASRPISGHSKTRSQDKRSSKSSGEVSARPYSVVLAPPTFSSIAEGSTESSPVEPPTQKPPQLLARGLSIRQIDTAGPNRSPSPRSPGLAIPGSGAETPATQALLDRTANIPTPERTPEPELVESIQFKPNKSKPKFVEKLVSAVGHSKKSPTAPKHQPSNASRFSFQYGSESAAQEQALEEKHRKLRTSEMANSFPRSRSPTEADDDDYFDEDAMDDMDEMEMQEAQPSFPMPQSLQQMPQMPQIPQTQPPTTQPPAVQSLPVQPPTVPPPEAPSQSLIYLQQARQMIQEPDSDDDESAFGDGLGGPSISHDFSLPFAEHYASRNASAFEHRSRQGSIATTVGGDGYWRNFPMDYYMQDSSNPYGHSRMQSQTSEFWFQGGSPMAFQGIQEEQQGTMGAEDCTERQGSLASSATSPPRTKPSLPHRDSGNRERNRVVSGMSFGSPTATPNSTQRVPSSHEQEETQERVTSGTSYTSRSDAFRSSQTTASALSMSTTATSPPPLASGDGTRITSGLSLGSPMSSPQLKKASLVVEQRPVDSRNDSVGEAPDAEIVSSMPQRVSSSENKDEIGGIGQAQQKRSLYSPDLTGPAHSVDVTSKSRKSDVSNNAVPESPTLKVGDAKPRRDAQGEHSRVASSTHTMTLPVFSNSPNSRPTSNMGTARFGSCGLAGFDFDDGFDDAMDEELPVPQEPPREETSRQVPPKGPIEENDDMYFDDGNFDQEDINGAQGAGIDENAFDDDDFLARPGMMQAVNHRRDRSSTAFTATSLGSDGPYPSFAMPDAPRVSQRYSQMMLEDLPLQAPVDPKFIPQRNPSEDMKRFGLTDRVPPVPVPETDQEAYRRMRTNLNSYHAALAEAANKAAVEGRFLRMPSNSTARGSSNSSKAAAVKPSLQLDKKDIDGESTYSDGEGGGEVFMPYSSGDSTTNIGRTGTTTSHLSHLTTYSPPKMSFDFGFDQVDDTEDIDDSFMNDDDLVAEANAEVLANDEDGFYGQEFDFYGRPRANSNELQTINGGYFGQDGDDGLTRNKSLREPNLTPITERSEFSTRNSFIGLNMNSFGPASAGPYGPHSPAIARMPVTPLIEGEVNSFDELRKLRANAFGDAGSLKSNSNRSSSHSLHMLSPGGSARPFPAGGVPMQFQTSNESNGSAAAHPAFAPGGFHDSPHSAASNRSMPFAMDPGATPKKNTTGVLPPEPTTARKVPPVQTQGSHSNGHSRNTSGADSVTYVRERDPEGSGKPRWVLERRRTSEQGQLELIGRELVQGGWI